MQEDNGNVCCLPTVVILPGPQILTKLRIINISSGSACARVCNIHAQMSATGDSRQPTGTVCTVCWHSGDHVDHVASIDAAKPPLNDDLNAEKKKPGTFAAMVAARSGGRVRVKRLVDSI